MVVSASLALNTLHLAFYLFWAPGSDCLRNSVEKEYLFKRVGRQCVGGVLAWLAQKPQVQSPGPHKTGVVVHTCKPSTLEVEYQDQKLKVILGYIANLK